MPLGQIVNPAGVWGAPTTALGQGLEYEALAAGTIAAGQIVALSTTEAQIVAAATNQAAVSLIGVALSAAVAGQTVLVVTGGPAYGVLKGTAAADNFAQFNLATISSTTTGGATVLNTTTAITQYAALGQVIGIAMAAAVTTATTVDLWIVRY